MIHWMDTYLEDRVCHEKPWGPWRAREILGGTQGVGMNPFFGEIRWDFKPEVSELLLLMVFCYVKLSKMVV